MPDGCINDGEVLMAFVPCALLVVGIVSAYEPNGTSSAGAVPDAGDVALRVFDGEPSNSTLSREALGQLAELAQSASESDVLPTVSLSIPEGPTVAAPLRRLYTPGEGRWSGYGLTDRGFYTLTVSGHSIHGAVYDSGLVYEFHGDTGAAGRSASITFLEAGKPSPFACEWTPQVLQAPDRGDGGAGAARSSTVTTIDIGVLHTRSVDTAVLLAGLGAPTDTIDARVALLIDGSVVNANAHLDASGISDVRYNLRSTFRSYADEEPLRFLGAEAVLETNNGVFDYVAELRDAANVDRVVFMTIGGETGGRAGSQGVVAVTYTQDTIAQIAMTGARVFSHELGHTFGLEHQSAMGPGSNRGYVYDDGALSFSTIMAARDVDNYLLQYSDPNATYMGFPLGDQYADAVFHIRDEAPGVSVSQPFNEPDDPFVFDCDGDGIANGIESAYGALDQIPNDDVPDTCVFTTFDPYLALVYAAHFPSPGGLPDINNNGIHDSVDVREGDLVDCNLDGRADAYYTGWDVDMTFETIADVAKTKKTILAVLADTPPPATDVQLDFAMDLQDTFTGPRDARVELFYNATSLGVVFDGLIPTCDSVAFSTVIPMAQFASGLLEGGAFFTADIDVATENVLSLCPRDPATLRLRYIDDDARLVDADRDGVLDDCSDDGCNLADWDNNGIIDLSDTDAFILAYIGLDDRADFAPPYGIWDLDDLDAFNAAFIAGCP